MIAVAVFMAYRTHRIHMKKEETEKVSKAEEEAVNPGNMKEFCIKNAHEVFIKATTYYNQIVTGTANADISKFRDIRKNITLMQKEARMQRKIVSQVLKRTVEQESGEAYFAIRTQDNLLEIISCLGIIAGASFNHIANHHKPLNQMQLAELEGISGKLGLLLDGITQIVAPVDNPASVDPEALKINIETEIEMCIKNEVRRIREEMTGNRISILFMSTLQETRNIVYYSSQIMQRLI